jgi:hypothetical protein
LGAGRSFTEGINLRCHIFKWQLAINNQPTRITAHIVFNQRIDMFSIQMNNMWTNSDSIGKRDIA